MSAFSTLVPCSTCASRWPANVLDNYGRCAICGLDDVRPATFHGQPEAWHETEEGQLTIFNMHPALVPASQVERVIYELREEVRRLNSEVIDLTTSITVNTFPGWGTPED